MPSPAGVSEVRGPAIGEDEGFALQAKDAPSGQICDHNALHTLTGVNQAEWDLVAAADHAMAHALLFHHLLEFTRIGIA